ncbi:MAG: GAF domain-containing protein [Gaiellaceae bacterium]
MQKGSAPRLLRETCRQLVEELDAAGCAISRLIGELLVELAEYTRTGQTLVLGHGYLLSDYPLTREVFELRRARIVSLAEEAPDPSEARVLEELGLETVMMLPLEVDGRSWALVEIYHEAGSSFADGDVSRAEEVVAEAGRRLEGLERS